MKLPSINTTREIHDKFLEDPEIKRLSALERDVLSQIIADKFYEKAEGASDAHYNLYIAFSASSYIVLAYRWP